MDQEVVCLNLGSVYWMDESNASYQMDKTEIKAAIKYFFVFQK